tara:strand:+ start:6186 stop:6962 length:777 start_codon:yes stop_codon:yes gene_type:complete
MGGAKQYSCGTKLFLKYSMTKQTQQVNSDGQALQKGVNVFMPVPVYSGEYLAYGNSFLLQTLSSAPDYASSTVDYATEVIGGAPASNANRWYAYHSEGTAYPVTTAPSTATNMLTMFGVNSLAPLSSHGGMYQQLSGLLVGFEYEVTINFHYTSSTGTITFSRFYYANQNTTTAIQTGVTTASLPSKQVVFTFVASSTNDVVFFDFSTTEVSSSSLISSIQIQKKDEYQLVVLSDVDGDGFSKVLREKDDMLTIPEEG